MFNFEYFTVFEDGYHVKPDLNIQFLFGYVVVRTHNQKSNFLLGNGFGNRDYLVIASCTNFYDGKGISFLRNYVNFGF